jgi:hypothetical protein
MDPSHRVRPKQPYFGGRNRVLQDPGLHLYGVCYVIFLDPTSSADFSSVLDDLSLWLRGDEHFGYAVIFVLIFITTFRELRFVFYFIFSTSRTFAYTKSD